MGFSRNFIKWFSYVASHTIYRLKIEGLENIPTEGAAILCANHLHSLDSVVCNAHIKRMVYAMAKEDLFKTKFKNWFMRQMGCFPVRKSGGSEEAVRRSVEVLEEGSLLMIFPEGTRNGLAKGVKPKNGAARIALKAHVPIIPIGIRGTFKLFSKITINVGKQIDLSQYYGEEKERNPQILSEITDNLMSEILELAKEK